MNRTASAAAVLAVIFLWLAPPAARADEVSDLLAKHKAFMGWQFNDAQTRDWQMTDTYADESGDARFVKVIKRIGALYRADTHSVKAHTNSSSGFTGNRFWYSDENGFTVPVFGGPAKVALAEDFFFTDAVAQLPWTNLHPVRKWKSVFSVVHVVQASGAAAPVDLYLDPATGAYAGIVIDPDGDNEETIRVVDYQVLGGRHFFSHWKYDDTATVHAISEIKLAQTLVADDLHPPAQTAFWQFQNPQPFPIRLTSKRAIVKAKVNGVEGTFMLDSGATNIFLSGAFARRAGLKALGHAQATTLYGNEKQDTGKADTIEIGGNTLHEVMLYFGSPETDVTAPDGNLGFDLFAGAIVTLDFENSSLQIQDPATVDVAAIPGVRASVDLNAGTPVTTMYVQGKATTVNATLDTGAPEMMWISFDLVTKHGLHLTVPARNGFACGFLDDMSIGPIVYVKPNACMAGMSSTRDVLLGYDFLKGLSKLYFDYRDATLILMPRAR